MTERKFHGWRFGGNLSDTEADELEPAVDIMTETLQELLRLRPVHLDDQSQHELALAITQYVGRGAGLVNDISLALVTENNADEKLRILNEKASQLRRTWMTVIAMSVGAVLALDKTLKEEDDGEHSTENVRPDPTAGS